MKKVFNWMLMASIVVGLGTTVIACSDDDDDDNKDDGKTPEQKAQEVEDGRVAFWNVVSQLVNPNDYTEDYKDKTFEPTIGEPDPSNPLVRIVAVNNLTTAAKRFGSLVDAKVDENTTTYEYKNDAVGKLTYTRTNDGKSLATIDVDIKQVPKLQQIRFVNPEQSDENGLFGFSGTAYYRFGDVISRQNEDGKTEYWVCVRPCFSKEGKSTSHWITVSPLPKKNVWDYEASNGKTYYLPTGLGKSTEHMQNLAELLFAMMQPHEWYYNLTENKNTPDFFHDFSVKNIAYHNQWFFSSVYEGWDVRDSDGKTLFRRIFNVDDTELWRAMTTGGGLKLLHSGYSWYKTFSWNCGLYQANYTNGLNAASNMHNESLSTPEHNMQNIDFNVNDLYNEQTMPLRSTDFFGDDQPRWIVRVAKGKELASNGKEKEQEALAGCKDVYRYNKRYQKKDFDLKTGPLVTNDGKTESNVGKIVNSQGKLFSTLKECIDDKRGVPVAMVVYDTKEADIEGVARLHRFSNQNLLCISLMPSSDGLVWGDKGNCGVKRYDIDKGQFAEMVRGVEGWNNTNNVIDDIEKSNHTHTAFKDSRSYFPEIYGGFYEIEGQGNNGQPTSDKVTKWFLPCAGEWRLFLKGMHAWVCSYDGQSVQSRIEKIYRKAGLVPGTKINIVGIEYDVDDIIPRSNSYWTSTDANDNEAYAIEFNDETGVRFVKHDKASAYRVYPFFILAETSN